MIPRHPFKNGIPATCTSSLEQSWGDSTPSICKGRPRNTHIVTGTEPWGYSAPSFRKWYPSNKHIATGTEPWWIPPHPCVNGISQFAQSPERNLGVIPPHPFVNGVPVTCTWSLERSLGVILPRPFVNGIPANPSNSYIITGMRPGGDTEQGSVELWDLTCSWVTFKRENQNEIDGVFEKIWVRILGRWGHW